VITMETAKAPNNTIKIISQMLDTNKSKRRLKTKKLTKRSRSSRYTEVEIRTKSVKLIRCACNKCDIMIPATDKRGRPHKYAKGHAPNNIRCGIGNKSWKGDNIGYESMHRWVRQYLPKPIDNSCQICRITDRKLELMCIGEYSRNLPLESNWKWACHPCNMLDPRTVKVLREGKIGSNNPMFGKQISEETRIKRSKAFSGPNNPMFGIRMSEESRLKMSLAQKNLVQRGIKNALGHRCSDEQKAKMSQAGRGRRPWNYGIRGRTKLGKKK
jgi:hypothetical protein